MSSVAHDGQEASAAAHAGGRHFRARGTGGRRAHGDEGGTRGLGNRTSSAASRRPRAHRFQRRECVIRLRRRAGCSLVHSLCYRAECDERARELACPPAPATPVWTPRTDPRARANALNGPHTAPSPRRQRLWNSPYRPLPPRTAPMHAATPPARLSGHAASEGILGDASLARCPAEEGLSERLAFLSQ